MRRSTFALIVLVSLPTFADLPRIPSVREPAFTAAMSEPPPSLGAPVRVVAVASDEVSISRGPDTRALVVGKVRALDSPVRVRSGGGEAAAVWRGAIRVPGAARSRLKLRLASPGNASMWVSSGDSSDWVRFGTESAGDGVLWTPSVAGEVIVLEVAGTASLEIEAAAAIRDLTPSGTECIRGAVCGGASFEAYWSAIGMYYFVSGGDVGACSGGLLNNDGGREFDPLFLTANHCVETAAEAASVEVFWDYRAASCGGSAPSLSSRPRTIGASVLVTSPRNDVSLLRLTSSPGGRAFLGWDPNAQPAGTEMFRFSHPEAGPLAYSTSRIETTSRSCQSLARPSYIYSRNLTGGIAGGSSGSPVMYDAANGYVIGQLLGTCGENDDDCDVDNRQVDGAFSESYDLLKRYLRPAAVTPQPCTPCVANANTACMLGGRMKVTMTWTDPYAGTSGTGRVVTMPGRPDSETYWSMYPQAPDALELVVRVVDGRGLNNKFWTSAGGFGVAGYTVRIQDTVTCAVWERTVAAGSSEIIKDTNALPGN